MLRGFFRHYRALYGEIAQQVYAMIGRFYNIAAGCRVLKRGWTLAGSASTSVPEWLACL